MRVRTVLAAVFVAAALLVTACVHPARPHPPTVGTATGATSPATGSAAPTASTASTTGTAAAVRSTSPSAPDPPPVLTPQRRWWGVDSTVPITQDSLDNVRSWYLLPGGTGPQFWGRYLNGSFALQPGELQFARAHGIYVYLLVPDRNCSDCAGGDICGNDRTAAQAQADAVDALATARAQQIPDGAILFKDIEQVSSCRAEPTADYLISWYRTMASSAFRTGFYGNSTAPDWDFPRSYCAATAVAADFAAGVVIDGNEPEPQLGAPRGTIGPAQAPAWAPLAPPCAAPTATVIWQYGESISNDNFTDVDQMMPGQPGLLAPNGSIT